MTKKFMLAFSTMALLVASAAERHNITLFQASVVNGTELAPGDYKVEVDNDSIYIDTPGALNVGELFSGISEGSLAQINALARREEYQQGGTLYEVGDPVEDFYVLESGRVEFLIGRDERTRPAGFMLRKGEVFGWAALLESQPVRIAKATCVEPSTLLRINGRRVLDVLEADPASGYVVMRRLSSLIARYLASSGAR